MTKLTESKWVWWFLAALTVFVYCYALNLPLLGPDEPRYAQVAREMFERGDWITPTLGGHHWFEKPALLYWLQIVSYNFFGETEFAARSGAAIFGLGTSLCLYLLAAFGNKDRTFAKWLAILSATSIGLLVFGRGASFDMNVTFPLTASLCGYYIFDRSSSDENRKAFLGILAFFFFAGVAVLAKGLIGILFPFAIVVFYHVLLRKLPSRHLVVSLMWGVPLMLAVAATWNLPMYLRHGWEFIDEFYIQHHFQRYTSNKYKHPQPFYFFWWVLPLMTFPWISFLFPGIWKAVKAVNSPDRASNEFASLRIFGLAWMLVPLVFFSVSGSKLPGYILPALPGAIILAATYIFEFIQRSEARKVAVIGVAAAMLIVVIGLLTFVVPRFAVSDSVKALISQADAAGYADSNVANFATLSHSAEFYAASRLLRDEHGVQITFYDPAFLEAEAERSGKPLLVLVPLKHLKDLKVEEFKPIADNGYLAIVALGHSTSAAR